MKTQRQRGAYAFLMPFDGKMVVVEQYDYKKGE
jgi:hypothetical protein